MSEPTLDFVIEKIAARISSAVLSSLAPHQFHAEGKLSYSEAEAAELLGIPRHVLKGVRERGEIMPRRVGKSYRYGRQMLLDFAEGKRNEN